MNAAAREKRERVKRLTAELGIAQEAVKIMERACTHTWDNPDGVYDPVHHKGYTIPRREGQGSHPPEPEINVPAKEDPFWVRTCTECGFTEETREPHQETVTRGGIFPDGNRHGRGGRGPIGRDPRW